MRNMFRGERRLRGSDRNNGFVNLKDKSPKPFTEADFPELSYNQNENKSENVSNMNFMDATTKEPIACSTDEYNVPFGWVYYTLENGYVHIKRNPLNKTCEYIDEDNISQEDYNYRANDIMNRLLNSHDRYRESYDDLNGEGAYDLIYKTLHQEQYADVGDDDYYYEYNMDER